MGSKALVLSKPLTSPDCSAVGGAGDAGADDDNVRAFSHPGMTTGS